MLHEAVFQDRVTLERGREMKKNFVLSSNGRGSQAGRIKLLSWNWVTTLR